MEPPTLSWGTLRYYALGGCTVVELGLAILFLIILVPADRRLLQEATDRVRAILDWLERSSAQR